MYYGYVLISGKYTRQLLVKIECFFLREFYCVRINVFNLVDFLLPFAMKVYLNFIRYARA